ncbi:hypothetical protein LJC74_00410 [Eubacteriales bacterium OttesenSCG-928-A19]|nr:hypothetical protein [Eubacteriales bacterium OttesenSCG-928-A19]
MKDEMMGRVLPFERSADELRALASRQLDHGQPLKSVELLRMSLAREPRDARTLQMLAEAYASMGCWPLSNEAFGRLLDDETYAAEAFYGMGENYLAMRQYGAAHDCFTLSLQRDPDAAFAGDAVDHLESIEEAEQARTPHDVRLQRRMDRVLRAMDRGNARLAARLIRRVLPLDSRSSGIRSMQAYALLSSGEPKAALKAARRALRHNPRDIRALSAMASALKANRSIKAARAFLYRAETLIDKPDDAQLVCQTACEIGEHDFVVSMLGGMEKHMPQSDSVLHVLAAALHNTGQTEEAVMRWRLLRRIDTLDTVASYYLRLYDAGTLPDQIPYLRQVPLSEMLHRMQQLRGWVQSGAERLQSRFDEDEALEAIIRWGLTTGESGIPKAMCGILSTLRGPRVEAMLRDVLLREEPNEAVKQSALMALHTVGAKGPFHAIMDGRVTLVHVSRVEDRKKDSEAGMLARLVAGWLRPYAGLVEAERVQLMCEASVRLGGGLKQAMKARAVVVAHCHMTGVIPPFSSTYAQRRKVDRLAARIIREVQ